jgi:hypothetical protein
LADNARREMDGQARWCGEKQSVHVPVGCWPGRTNERPEGEAGR